MANAKSSWSIGIYAGPSPLALLPHPDAANPVLSRLDVTDVTASFVADPFMIERGGTWYLFFEVLHTKVNRGEIGLAESADGLRWRYRGIVLREPYHLSYPYVFESNGAYYMVPESVEAARVQLYRAERFPYAWTAAGTLLEAAAADASPFHYHGAWWMFACTAPYRQDVLRLYRAESLTGPWTEHPKSPLVNGNPHIARPAGRVVNLHGRLLRFAQDCHPEYGMTVCAFEVNKLTESDYCEVEARPLPLLVPGAEPWNRGRMHHIDAHPLADNRWIACVDGDSECSSKR